MYFRTRLLLHPSKDLAVSPSKFPLRFTKKISRCSLLFSLERLCSHLAPHGGRVLPATFPRKLGLRDECSDFPLNAQKMSV